MSICHLLMVCVKKLPLSFQFLLNLPFAFLTFTPLYLLPLLPSNNTHKFLLTVPCSHHKPPFIPQNSATTRLSVFNTLTNFKSSTFISGMEKLFESVLQSYMRYTLFDIEALANGVPSMCLTVLKPADLKSLLSRIKSLFAAEPVMLTLKSPCIIVGDLHGHLLDLLRVLKNHGLPLQHKYLFLGDIVDRGEFSLETSVIVFILKFLYPESVYIIRGNHEFDSLASQYGFLSELQEVYHDQSIYDAFMDVFSVMPFSAVVDNSIICVHGGIGPKLTNINQLASLERPMADFDAPVVSDLVWSDPSDRVQTYGPSPRGMGCRFGRDSAALFLKCVKKKVIVRGHECAQDGVHALFNGTVITVFTASNYCGVSGNQAGVLIVNRDGYEMKRYPALNYLRRQQVEFDMNMGAPVKAAPVPTKKMLTKISRGPSKTEHGKMDFMEVNIAMMIKHRRANSGSVGLLQ